jgi:heme-degrading monooxygenase HmoA
MKNYYAVIFSSEHSESLDGYPEMAAKMEELAKKQEGFLGFKSAREGKVGITVSYWASLDAIKKWKANIDHLAAQKMGKEKWYKKYSVHIARVEREYSFP